MLGGVLALVLLSPAQARAATQVDCPPFARPVASPTPRPPAADSALTAPTGLHLAAPTSTLSGLSQKALRKSVRYTLRTWLPHCFGDQDPAQPIDPRGSAERQVRPLAMAAYSLAIALQTSAYDESAIGVPRDQALRTTKRIVTGLIAHHRANDSSDQAWGHGWQSSLWTYYIGYAGWLISADLTPDQSGDLARMLRDEADYRAKVLQDQGVPYMYSKSGRTLHPGDSYAEENAWNSMAPSLAAFALPPGPQTPLWRTTAARYQIGSYIRQSDTTRTRMIDGSPLRASLGGFNMRSDGTVINHNRLHPEYMSLITMKATELLNAAPAGASATQSTVYNLPFMHDTFRNRPMPNGAPIYRPGSWRINYPQGNDWGTGRISNYALLDATAAQLTAGSRRSAITAFQRRHLDRQLALMARFTDGRTYKGTWNSSGSEYSYVGREQITAADLAQIWLTEYFGAHHRLQFGPTEFLS